MYIFIKKTKTNLWRSNAFVETTIIGMNARNIQMWHDITIDRDVLSHLQSLGVRQPFSIKFPGNFGGRIPAGNTLQKHARSGLKSLFGEGLTDLRGLDYR